ncbi:hypothetical protein, partial [Lachnoanaerobaculum saburreum]
YREILKTLLSIFYQKGEWEMKVVNEPRIGGMEPLAGCTCSSGQKKTRGPWDPIWNCNCQCNGGTTNYNANHDKASER